MTVHRGIWTAAVSALVCAAPAHGQWLVEASAGGVSHEIIGTSPATSTSSVILGLRHEGPHWLYLASGIPFGEGATPWAALGGGGRDIAYRSALGSVGLDWAGHANGYRAPDGVTGAAFTIQALPYIGTDIAGLSVEARSGVVHYAATTSAAVETISRTAHDSGIMAALRPHPRLVVVGDARYLRSEGAAYPYMGLSAELGLPGASIWGYGGRWSDPALPDATWGAGATLEVGPRISIRAAVQQDATDPVYWNETRRFWSIGVRGRIGPDPPMTLAVPVAPETSRGRVVFRIPVSASPAAPSVAGDFNGWVPAPMERIGDEWVVALRIDAGVYQYAFRDPEGGWFVPDSVQNRVDDGFGGTNAVLVVPERGR